MSQFIVKWEQEIHNAESPIEAAKWCAEDIANGESMMFTVLDLQTGIKHSIDLSKASEELPALP